MARCTEAFARKLHYNNFTEKQYYCTPLIGSVVASRLLLIDLIKLYSTRSYATETIGGTTESIGRKGLVLHYKSLQHQRKLWLESSNEIRLQSKSSSTKINNLMPKICLDEIINK